MAKKKQPKTYPGSELLAVGRGGARKGSGRKKLQRENWAYITCILRKDTIAKLKAGGGGLYYGEFLQWVLDRYPIPSREYYEAIKNGETDFHTETEGRVIIVPPIKVPTPEERHQQRLDKAMAKMSPAERSLIRNIQKTFHRAKR